jgi:CubicO group peptidase (beta-lactamase class C family)
VLRRHKRLSSPPGTKFRYSNIGYWLLGEFVERVSGQVFTAYVIASVLRPLGLTSLELGYQVPNLEKHACGYLEKYSLMNFAKRLLLEREYIGSYCGRWLEILPHVVNGAAFGGLVGTASGIGTFLRDQLRPQSVVLGDVAKRNYYAQQRTNRGSVVPMTLGWHVGDLQGHLFYFKEGGGGGFHCMMRLYPNAGFGTVVMTNATRFNVARLLNAMDREFLPSGGNTRDRSLVS